jgi:hypothetical protein
MRMDADVEDAELEPTGQFTLVIRDFQTNEPLSTCLSYYADNQVPVSDTCGTTMTNASGEVVLPLFGHDWFAHRLYATVNRLGWLRSNRPTPSPGASLVDYSVSYTTASTITGLLGRTYTTGTATFLGVVEDAAGSPLQGAIVRAVRAGQVTPIAEGATASDPMYAYFGSDNLPSSTEPYTNTNGLYIAINMPVLQSGEVVQLVACGTPGGETWEVIGCEETRVFPDTYHHVALPPTRAGGPTCPSVCP